MKNYVLLSIASILLTYTLYGNEADLYQSYLKETNIQKRAIMLSFMLKANNRVLLKNIPDIIATLSTNEAANMGFYLKYVYRYREIHNVMYSVVSYIKHHPSSIAAENMLDWLIHLARMRNMIAIKEIEPDLFTFVDNMMSDYNIEAIKDIFKTTNSAIVEENILQLIIYLLAGKFPDMVIKKMKTQKINVISYIDYFKKNLPYLFSSNRKWVKYMFTHCPQKFNNYIRSLSIYLNRYYEFLKRLRNKPYFYKIVSIKQDTFKGYEALSLKIIDINAKSIYKNKRNMYYDILYGGVDIYILDHLPQVVKVNYLKEKSLDYIYNGRYFVFFRFYGAPNNAFKKYIRYVIAYKKPISVYGKFLDFVYDISSDRFKIKYIQGFRKISCIHDILLYKSFVSISMRNKIKQHKCSSIKKIVSLFVKKYYPEVKYIVFSLVVDNVRTLNWVLIK